MVGRLAGAGRNVLHHHLLAAVVERIGIGGAVVWEDVVGARVARRAGEQREADGLLLALRHAQADDDGEQRYYRNFEHAHRQLEAPEDPVLAHFGREPVHLRRENWRYKFWADFVTPIIKMMKRKKLTIKIREFDQLGKTIFL